MDNLLKALENAAFNKTNYAEVKQVREGNKMAYLRELQSMLKSKTYHTSKYIKFDKVECGKLRHIAKLPFFPDRIAQWALLQIIEPYITKTFIFDTYSSIKDRGVHQGKQRVEAAMHKHGNECRYCLKIDVHHFYESINHDILKQMYRKLFKDKDLLWLIDEIIDSTEGDTGIPIGNYLSQFSANLYLSYFDHWVKEQKQIKYYFRYMDDMVFFSDNKEESRRLLTEIDVELKKLKLTIKPNWQIFPTYVRGLDFLGYVMFRDYTLLRKKVKKRAGKRLRSHLRSAQRKGLNLHQFGSICSYKGWMEHCNSYRLRRKYILPLLPYLVQFYNERHENDEKPKKKTLLYYQKQWNLL